MSQSSVREKWLHRLLLLANVACASDILVYQKHAKFQLEPLYKKA